MAKFTMMEVEAILNRLAGEKAERFQREVLYPQLARAMRIPLPDLLRLSPSAGTTAPNIRGSRCRRWTKC
jgi:hypothetical protein